MDTTGNKKSTGQRMWDLLQEEPENYDIFFLVGPEKKKVEAVSFILKAASPEIRKEFKEAWGKVKKGNGIPLPSLDPAAFQMFIKLLILDTWSTEAIDRMNLTPEITLRVLGLCNLYGVVQGIPPLEKAAKKFISKFGEYRKKQEFLHMSRDILEIVLACEDLPLSELEVFETALTWAEFQCKEAKLGVTDENMRKVLGGCLNEIRFPALTVTEFSELMTTNKDILSAQDKTLIFEFIGLNEEERDNFDTRHFNFKTHKRRSKKEVLRMLNLYSELGHGEFDCNGSSHFIELQPSETILLQGVGFFGPTEGDSDYDINVQMFSRDQGTWSYLDEKIHHKIKAKKDKNIYFTFPQPIKLTPVRDIKWNNCYQLKYWIEGNPISMLKGYESREDKLCAAGGVEFRLRGVNNNNAISELRFMLT